VRGRPARVVVGSFGLAAVGVLALVATFLPWYGIGGERSDVSGWSMLTSHGFSFESPIDHTSSHGPTGGVTLLAGLVLLAVAYAAWWLAGPSPHASDLTRREVRGAAALVGVFACLALVLPLGVPAGEDANARFVASMPRVLCIAGLSSMGVLLALAFVPRHSQ
jgi:hypothetical protein